MTDKQAEWIKAKIASGHFGNESEVVRELIPEEETPAEIEVPRSLKGSKADLGRNLLMKYGTKREHSAMCHIRHLVFGEAMFDFHPAMQDTHDLNVVGCYDSVENDVLANLVFLVPFPNFITGSAFLRSL